MTTARPSRRKKLALAALATLATAALLARFPLVRINRIGAAGASAEQPAFDADQFASRLWQDRLAETEGRAHDAAAVLAALRENPADACRRFGRSPRGARSCFYMLRGRGVVVSVEKNALGVALVEGTAADVLVSTGLLFGNALRDAPGWVDPNDFASLQDYNAVAEALNRIVETRVIADFKSAVAVGRRVSFLGAVEVKRSPAAGAPLTLVPIQVAWE